MAPHGRNVAPSRRHDRLPSASRPAAGRQLAAASRPAAAGRQLWTAAEFRHEAGDPCIRRETGRITKKSKPRQLDHIIEHQFGAAAVNRLPENRQPDIPRLLDVINQQDNFQWLTPYQNRKKSEAVSHQINGQQCSKSDQKWIQQVKQQVTKITPRLKREGFGSVANEMSKLLRRTP